MNRLKNIRLLFLLVLFSLFFITHISVATAANQELESLHIHVKLHSNGNGTVSETRKVFLTEGTENFIPIEDLGQSTIADFVVKENEIVYEYIDNWDSEASKDEKTFKNGLIETSEGYELVWGIGSYGAHEYVLEYTIIDMVKQLKDAQVLFWRLVNDQTNIPPQQVTIEIEADWEMSQENENIWAFGFEGEINFENGQVITRSDKPFNEDNFATVLIEFQDGTFTAKDFVHKTFAEVRDKAFEGSDYEQTWKDFIFGALLIILILFLLVVLPILLIKFIVKMTRTISYKINRRRIFRKIKQYYEDEYYRTLPYEHDIIDLFYLFQKMQLSTFNSLKTAFLLRWIHEGTISLDTKTTGFLREKEHIVLCFHKNDRKRGLLEERLYKILYGVSSVHKKMSPAIYTRWSARAQTKMKHWQKDVCNHSRKQLVVKGYLQKQGEKFILTKQGKELEGNIYRFINYLRNFSLLHEHDTINVKLWDELMIWAASLGIADVVMEQFEHIYPSYTSESVYTSLDTIHTINAISRETSKMAKERPDSFWNDRSSGGGGSTSIGGGGGSFGGGSGGGTR